MTNCLDTRPVMVTEATQLTHALDTLAGRFPDIHTPILTALGQCMGSDGVMEFTVSGLAKLAEVRMSLAKDYLKTARSERLLDLIGRRTDNGKMRYCAYQPVAATRAVS